ncbi:vegetative cell wall protein gp1-like [Passer montanus]|uniref:vegetative cell wall protein gp1-like n=1 Tax=Passer montanus TaxID=9160 RepID=UPI00196203E9|nr:vegetative cell wall protein gp1-like [Passer montanus]
MGGTPGQGGHQVLALLGTRVRLRGFGGYRAQLDTRTDSTGTHSLYTTYHGYEVMFHVSTMLPFTPRNPQQLLRKRHIGNDIVTIVFQEPGALPFSPRALRSHFQHVFLVVRVHEPGTPRTSYRWGSPRGGGGSRGALTRGVLGGRAPPPSVAAPPPRSFSELYARSLEQGRGSGGDPDPGDPHGDIGDTSSDSGGDSDTGGGSPDPLRVLELEEESTPFPPRPRSPKNPSGDPPSPSPPMADPTPDLLLPHRSPPPLYARSLEQGRGSGGDPDPGDPHGDIGDTSSDSGGDSDTGGGSPDPLRVLELEEESTPFPPRPRSPKNPSGDPPSP